MNQFEILGEIMKIETIAAESSVHIRRHLERAYGAGNWLKRKGIASIRLADGTIRQAEIHWFEAHGIGRKDFKIKKVIQ